MQCSFSSLQSILKPFSFLNDLEKILQCSLKSIFPWNKSRSLIVSHGVFHAGCEILCDPFLCSTLHILHQLLSVLERLLNICITYSHYLYLQLFLVYNKHIWMFPKWDNIHNSLFLRSYLETLIKKPKWWKLYLLTNCPSNTKQKYTF